MPTTVLDKRLLTQNSTEQSPILALRNFFFFPKTQHKPLLGSLDFGEGFDPRGIWRPTGNVTDTSGFEPGCDPLYEVERLITSTNQVKLGQKQKIRMSTILGHAKLSKFHDGVEIGEDKLDEVNPTYVKFKNPEGMMGFSGGFKSPFGIFSIECLKDKPDYCRFVRVATWHQGIRGNSNLSILDRKGRPLDEVETPPLGEETITHRIVAECYMLGVSKEEIGW